MEVHSPDGESRGVATRDVHQWDAAAADLAVAVAGEIERLKAGDALAPVTIVVPSPYAGLSLRREIARRGGVANCRFVTATELASLLGVAALAAARRTPLPDAVRYWAIDEALAPEQGAAGGAPGLLSSAAGHVAAVRAIAGRLAELRRVEPARLARIAASGPSAAAVVGLLEAVRGRTPQCYDTEDVVDAAAAAVDAGSPVLREVGRVLWLDGATVTTPGARSAGERALMSALADAGRLTTIAAESRGTLPAVERIVVAPDADTEIRLVGRTIMREVRRGTPLHRMAVLYASPEPYRRLLTEHLAACDWPVAGPSAGVLAQSLAGRTLQALLTVADRRFSRHAVMEMLNGAPARDWEGRPIPVARWEVLARDANIVAGSSAWSRRLGHLGDRMASDAQRRESAGRDGSGARQRERDVRALAAWVAGLVARCEPPPGAGWAALAQWAEGLLHGVLDVAALEATQASAAEAVCSVLAGLGRLGTLGATQAVAPSRFVAAVELALGAPLPAAGAWGSGVFVGPIAAAVGCSFDLVMVVGMIEGELPARRSPDPLLDDAARRAGGGVLADGADRRDAERRALSAALAAGARRVAFVPRSDQRSQQVRLPSRWAVELAAPLAARSGFEGLLGTGHLLASRDDWPWLEIVPSLASIALRDDAASAAEVVVGELGRWVAAGCPAPTHPVVRSRPALARGLAAVDARAAGGLTEYEGLVGRHPELAMDPGRPLGATALQQWAECPRRYLLDHVLRVGETASPEDVMELHPLERGTLVHDALERFFREKAQDGELGFAWTADDGARLLEILDDCCDEAEARGLTGRRVPWLRQRRQLREQLATFLARDVAYREPRGLVPEHFELAFGDGADDGIGPVLLQVGERAIRFRGRIDRVDVSADRRAVEVIDYKTGGSKYYQGIEAGDPVKRGLHLQLPLYALAVEQGYPDAAITAAYWFVTDTGAGERQHLALPLDDNTRARFVEVVGRIADGIEDGLFPANPGEEDRDSWQNCRRCPYERVCPTERDEIWQRVVMSDEAAPYRLLAGDEP